MAYREVGLKVVGNRVMVEVEMCCDAHALEAFHQLRADYVRTMRFDLDFRPLDEAGFPVDVTDEMRAKLDAAMPIRVLTVGIAARHGTLR